MNRVEWEIKAVRQLRKIDPQNRERIRAAVETLAHMPRVLNVKALTNHSAGFRLRVGRYRVLFDWEQSVRVVNIVEVKKRDDRTY